MADFFYSEQTRRYLLQFTRIFSNFQVAYGRAQEVSTNNPPGHTLVRVPVRYGDASRQAQTIMQQNSASSMPSTPLMTFYITDLSYDRPRVQEPYFVDTIAVRQRKYNQVSRTYDTMQGNAFSIDRPMPVPYKMTVNLDIWTSNTNQKFQLWEQIVPLFNPSLEIQATDSYIDWTTITVVELTGNKWSSRTIPVGTEDPIDISTFTFEIPIWISPPVKVKKLGMVQKIIASVYDERGDLHNAINGLDILDGTRTRVTPYRYAIQAIDIGLPTGRIQILGGATPTTPPNVTVAVGAPNTDDVTVGPVNQSVLYWHPVVAMYGNLREDPVCEVDTPTFDPLRAGVSYISLEQPDGSEVICQVAYNPLDDRFLLVTCVDPDTLPQNTPGIGPIDRVVNPLEEGPGSGLPIAVDGQCYLFTEGTGNPDYLNVDPSHYPPMGTGQRYAYAYAWASTSNTPLIAGNGDIVRYSAAAGEWVVVFSASGATESVYVTCLADGQQYCWDGVAWRRSVDGTYHGGDWSLTL